MTRKHHLQLAAVLAESRDIAAGTCDFSHLLNGLMVVLEQDNPQFNRLLFVRAVLEHSQ